MKVLTPIDGSDCSTRALEFAIGFVQRYDGALHVVHVTDYEGERTEAILSRAEARLDEAGIDDHPEVVSDIRLSRPRYANQVGRDILRIAEDGDYDHVVIGSHGTGRLGRAILGSAAETVVRAAELPSTVVP